MGPTRDELGVLNELRGLERRDFLKAAAVAVAAGAVPFETALSLQPVPATSLESGPPNVRAGRRR